MKQQMGTNANLKTGPRTVEAKPFAGGTKQQTGTAADLKGTPSGLQEFSKGTQGGVIQGMGQKADLNPRQAIHGWQSYPAPVSQRTEKQSK